MAHVTGEIIIHRPVEVVFDFVADERHEPSFNPEMLEVELATPPPIGQGSRFGATLRRGRRTMPMTIEFIGFERPRRIASISRSADMEATGEVNFVAVSDGTRMSWNWDVRPYGALKLAGPLVGVIGRRQERRVWGNLKRLLESG